jgi:GNAT superfamily N-acetyltransferase
MRNEPIDGIDVRRLREHGQGLLLDLLGREGAPVPPEVRDLRQRYYCTDRFRAYLARIDGEPAGWATLFVHEGMGILGNAATLTEFRGRGVQSALFRARAADALDIALAWVTVDVEPGSVSHRNAFRAGMLPRTSVVWWR